MVLRLVSEKALTFDDVLLEPLWSEVLPSEVITKTRLTKNIDLNIPLMSAAMDTVTEAKMAIALAECGGIGFVHKNMSIKDQKRSVRQVKRHQAGVVRDPVTVTPTSTVGHVRTLQKEKGFSCFPVVNNHYDKILVGLCTARDIRFETDELKHVSELMTSRESVVSFTEYPLLTRSSTPPGSSPSLVSEIDGEIFVKKDISIMRPEFQRLMHERKVEKVMLVDPEGRLTGIVTSKDFDKMKQHPNACVDDLDRLRCGAAVGCDSDAMDRVHALVEEGVDVILVDSSHGHSYNVINRIKEIREAYPTLEIIGGNVATSEGTKALIEAGCSAVKVGIGPGSICTTRVVTGVGVPQLTAISNAVAIAAPVGIPIIADGGVRYSGDLCKAIAAGSSAAMMGSIFAGAEEAPGELLILNGRRYKTYRGMGSIKAMERGSADRYFQQDTVKRVPEGVEGKVAYTGSCQDILTQVIGGLRSCMGLTGCRTIPDLQTKPRFYQITSSGVAESHVHNVIMTKEAPNYPIP